MERPLGIVGTTSRGCHMEIEIVESAADSLGSEVTHVP